MRASEIKARGEHLAAIVAGLQGSVVRRANFGRTVTIELPADIAITSIPHLTSIGFPSTLIGYEPRMRSRALGTVGGTIAYLNRPDLPPVPTQMGIYKIELAVARA